MVVRGLKFWGFCRRVLLCCFWMSEMAVVSAGAPMAEESPLSGEASATTLATQISKGEADLTDSRHSMRKRLPRSPSMRGRRVKSCPKSPLMRMAEMRKGGLRASALRQSGGKDLDESGFKRGKGRKGAEGKGSRELVAIPENSVVGAGSMGGSGLDGFSGEGVAEGVPGADCVMVVSGEGDLVSGVGVGEVGGGVVDVEGTFGNSDGLFAGAEEGVVGVGCFSGGVDAVMSDDRFPGESETVVAAGSPYRSSGEGCSKMVGQADVFSAGLHSDLSLDLIAAQLLQEMAFIGEQGPTEVVYMGGKDSHMGEDFSSLSKDNLRAAKEQQGRNRGSGEKEVPKVLEQPLKVNLSSNKKGSSYKPNGNSWSAARNYKATVTDGKQLGGRYH